MKLQSVVSMLLQVFAHMESLALAESEKLLPNGLLPVNQLWICGTWISNVLVHPMNHLTLLCNVLLKTMKSITTSITQVKNENLHVQNSPHRYMSGIKPMVRFSVKKLRGSALISMPQTLVTMLCALKIG